MIYFDNSATTRTSELVNKTIYDCLSSEETFGNPGSLHKLGVISSRSYFKLKERLAKELGCKDAELYITSCGTESANTAIRGYLSKNPRNGRKVISTRTEHKATLEVLDFLSNHGIIVKYISVDSDGKPNMEELEREFTSDTALLCFTHVNNETGSILPLEDIVKLRNKVKRDCAIYIDMVQSFGKLDINLASMGVDMASFSAHKAHGPKGVGALFVRNGLRIDPLILGGGQQNNMRSGTQSLMLLEAMTVAFEETNSKRPEAYPRVKEINAFLREELSKRNCIILSPYDALPYVLNVSFDGFQSETMLHCLEMYEVYVSTVSACSSKSKKVSYVLDAMGIDRKLSTNAVRLSFSRYNTLEQAKEFINIVDEIYKKFLIRKF